MFAWSVFLEVWLTDVMMWSCHPLPPPPLPPNKSVSDWVQLLQQIIPGLFIDPSYFNDNSRSASIKRSVFAAWSEPNRRHRRLLAPHDETTTFVAAVLPHVTLQSHSLLPVSLHSGLYPVCLYFCLSAPFRTPLGWGGAVSLVWSLVFPLLPPAVHLLQEALGFLVCMWESVNVC